MGPKNFLPIGGPGCGPADRGKVPNRTAESPCPRASVAQRAREAAPGSGLPGPDLSSAISRNLGSPAGGQPSPSAQQRWLGRGGGCCASSPPHGSPRPGCPSSPCSSEPRGSQRWTQCGRQPTHRKPKGWRPQQCHGWGGGGEEACCNRDHGVGLGARLGKLRGTDPTLPGRPSS